MPDCCAWTPWPNQRKGRVEMWRTLVALILIMTARVSMAEQPIEPGVSLELAEQRATVLSGVRYELQLAIPPERNSAIPGRVGIEFD